MFAHHRLCNVAFVLITAVLLTPMIVLAAPVSFDWGSFSASASTDYGLCDESGDALPNGSLVQLIWAGADGVIDPPTVGGGTTDDDQVLDSTTKNDASLPPPLRDKGYLPLRTYSFDSDAAWSGGLVFIRSWNAASAAAATRYGDSTLATLSSGGSYNATRFCTALNPSAVALATFTAYARDEAVVLAWETVSEVDHIGFNLYRAGALSGPWQCINAQLIPSAGPGSGAGATYEWTDSAVVEGAAYWYRLEALDTLGAAETVGETSVVAGDNAGAMRLWLPLVAR